MLEQGDTVRAIKSFEFGPISSRTCQVTEGTEGKILSVWNGRAEATYRIDFGVGEIAEVRESDACIELVS